MDEGGETSSPTFLPPETARQYLKSRRVRVTRACDRCKQRKIRCTGIQPCEICRLAKTSCTYTASYTRGRLRPIQKDTSLQQQDDPGASGALVSRIAQEVPEQHDASWKPAVPAPQETGPILDGHQQKTAEEPSSRESPEPGQTDLDGQYIGPASGVSFLLRARRRLQQRPLNTGSTSIFTFDDAPLPEPDPSFRFISTKSETERLVRRYFDFVSPVDRFLYRPAVERWQEEFLETSGYMGTNDDICSRKALLYMIFAMAQDHISPKPTTAVSDISIQLFLAADQQLAQDRGPVRLTNVQARLCQCLWLLLRSRVNHCYSLFGTVAHMAIAIGLNRNINSVNPNRACYTSEVELECRRRTFWSMYCLDNHLSLALGRPKTFHDEDIDQELPSFLDNSDLYPSISSPDLPQSSLIVGPVAYYTLSRIVSSILRDLYSVRSSSSSSPYRHVLVDQYSQVLDAWGIEMSKFLEATSTDTNLHVTIFQRQRTILNLTYWHTMILTHRPILLDSASRSNGKSLKSRSRIHVDQVRKSVRECLHAAKSIADTIDNLTRAGQLFQAFWFTSYCAFSATAILYFYVIQGSSCPELCQEYLEAALRCQDQISSIAERNSLVSRYCILLDELKIEALKRMESSSVNTITSDNFNSLSDSMRATLIEPPSQTTFAEFNDAGLQIGDSVEDLIGWAQFESMVIPEFGALEALLNNDGIDSGSLF